MRTICEMHARINSHLNTLVWGTLTLAQQISCTHQTGMHVSRNICHIHHFLLLVDACGFRENVADCMNGRTDLQVVYMG